MFNLFNKNTAPTSYATLEVDFHSHLIPGIDDGAKTIEDSITLIKGLIELGFQTIITSPHILHEFYPNTSDIIKKGEEKVLEALEQEKIAISFKAAAEYYVDEHFKKLVKAKDLLPIYKNYVLIELSTFGETPDLHQDIFELRTAGFRPILAHPERYIFYANNFDAFHELKDWGCLFQLNILSLQGHYGKNIQSLAKKLLKEGLIDFMATDLHNKLHLEALKKALSHKLVGKWLKEEWKNKDLNA